MAAPGFEVTLCTGDGPVTVTLDGQGNPVAPAHHCPACILALPLPPVPVALAQPALRVLALPAPPSAKQPARAPVRATPPARAPPLSA